VLLPTGRERDASSHLGSGPRQSTTLERMSKAKRALFSAVAAALVVAGVFALLGMVEGSIAGRIFVAAGLPLGTLFLQVLPDSTLRAVAPEGGANAVGWVFALSAVTTWLLIVFALCFLITGRMRSNSAAHPEPLKRRTLSPSSSCRPGGRGR